MQQCLVKYVQKIRNGDNYDVAKLVYKYYKYEFKCTDINRSIWYKFENNKWQLDEEGYGLRNEISSKIYEIIMMYIKWLSYKKEDKEKINGYTKIIVNIKLELFKQSVFNICKGLFYDQDFANKLDSNVNLICFNNGVYDLGKDIFRIGFPDDHLSSTFALLRMRVTQRLHHGGSKRAERFPAGHFGGNQGA